MKVLGIYKQIPKTKWQEMTKIMKERGVVSIYPVIVHRHGKPSSVGYAILAVDEGKVSYSYRNFGEREKLKNVFIKAEKLKDLELLEDAIFLYRMHYEIKENAIQSGSVIKVAEAIREDYGKQLERVKARHVIITEEGILGIIGDLVTKVSRKIARDTFKVQYSEYIQGEMKVSNTSLRREKPTNKAYPYTVAIGADEYQDEVQVSIMHGDDTERGVGGNDTYITHDFNLRTFPLKDLKEGNYRGADFEKLLDIVFRALILSSSEGYNEYALEKGGNIYYGEGVNYSWLTLKDGTKVTWGTYNFGELAQLLRQ